MIALAAFVIGVAVGVVFMCVAFALAFAAREPRAPRCGHDIDCGDTRC